MTVYFIGAGPGAPDLITVRGLKYIEACPICLYAGSLVPIEVVAAAPQGALVVDTAPLHLDQIIEHMVDADKAGQDVARVHSGDPSLYGAIAEQIRRLEALGIEYEIVPGVPAFAAAAAVLKQELTLPGIGQSLIITRTEGAASPMPEGEDLATLGRSGTTLAIHLSVRNAAHIIRELEPNYGLDCPVVIAYRVTWPDERIIRTTLGGLKESIRAEKLTRTTLIFVGKVLDTQAFEDSRLYHETHRHILRTGK